MMDLQHETDKQQAKQVIANSMGTLNINKNLTSGVTIASGMPGYVTSSCFQKRSSIQFETLCK